jgi:hypothetical protein
LVAELIEQDSGELGLLALHPIGMTGDVRDAVEIELREQPLPLGAILELRRLQSLRDQRLGGAENV